DSQQAQACQLSGCKAECVAASGIAQGALWRRDSGCAANTKLVNNMATIKAQMRRLAEAAGATFIRFGKGGHELYQLRGNLVTIPGSPGDRRALENSAAVILTNDVGRIADTWIRPGPLASVEIDPA